jgi:hypothetical protein
MPTPASIAGIGDTKPVGSACECGAGAFDGAVTVRIRLDDGHHVLGADHLAQVGDVRGERGEVDDRLAEDRGISHGRPAR